ncbi:hypothetical protein BGZ97_011938 [Linnemannia gamsii]|uniref:LysM domain-containing protein n=1 Tax=Linnemannia gamsii TaxID=64522 RepID=A0A9P6RN26_9FUNG|nr:hypothetical protein BGZ97_011938 [Linnemannia gamsii]
MKFTATLLVLAAVASSAMAVVPIPVEGCRKTVVVKATDTGCIQFAGDNGTTFANLLKWNNKLRSDCANLDVGHPLCVLGPKEHTKPTKPVKPTKPPTKPVKPTHPTHPTHPTKPVKPTHPTKPVKPTPKPKETYAKRNFLNRL